VDEQQKEINQQPYCKDPNENIASFISVKEFDEKHFVFMFTAQGLVKK